MTGGEVVNLRRARKAREREEARARAAENRVRHGRTKAAKSLDRLNIERADERLEGHRRDDGAS